MSKSGSLVRFVDDKRGVSAVIGFILIFGILVLALTTYQAAIVPQQNAQTEFEHFEDNRDELIEFRDAVSTAGQSNVSQFPNIKLGTNYQTRLFTINPPPPSGTIQTSETYNITISDSNGENTKNISTRFVEYRPGYNEISVGSTWYEHSVLYLDEREQSGQNIIRDQNIVSSSGTITITALQNPFQETRTGRVTLELYPQEQIADDDFPDGDNLKVTIPTRLNGSDYWDDELDDTTIYQGVDDYEGADGVYEVKLDNVDSDDLRVNTVGIQDKPNEDPAKNVRIGNGGQSGDGDDGSEINPAAPGNVQLVGTSWSNNDEVTLTFRNSAGDNSFTKGRISFYFSGRQGNSPTEVEDVYVVDANGNEIGDSRLIDNSWAIGEDFEDLDPVVDLEGEGSRTRIRLDFDDSPSQQNDFFVVSLGLETGERATYFVGGVLGTEEEEEEEGGEGEPTFNTLSADSDIQSSNVDELRSVEFNGEISNPDEGGSVLFELEKEGDTYYEEDISMEENVDFNTGNNIERQEIPVEVRITLLDSNGSIYEEIVGEFTETDDEELTLNDGLSRE